MTFDFGPFRIDPQERQLLRGDEVVPLTAKAFDVLHLLVRNSGRTVTKEEFMAEVWAGTVVEEGNLTDNISTLRQALDDDAREPKYIRTVPKRGYRFLAAVTERSDAPPTGPLMSKALNDRWLVPAMAAAVIILGLVLAVRMIPQSTARAPHVASPQRSVAVLPFKPLSSADRDASLEMGMTDALIAKLSRIREITVRPTISVIPYADREVDLREVAAKLGVETLLDGKLQKSGDRLRVSVQLIRAADGVTLWADHFDERFTDIFAVQDAISERVAAALAVRLSGSTRALLTRRPTENVEAYQLYLSGLHQWRSFAPDDLLASINYFNAALKLDPSFALAWAGLGRSYAVIGIYGPLDEREAFPNAQAAIAKALELDPSLPDAHVVNAAIKVFYERDWQGVKQSADIVQRIDPSNGEIHSMRGYYLKAVGRPAEAVAHLDLAAKAAPEWSVTRNDSVIARLDAGHYDEAIALALKELALDPKQSTILRCLGRAYAAKGDYANAIGPIERSIPLHSRGQARGFASLAWVYARSGRREKALELLEKVKRDSNPWMPFEVAKIYAGLGDRDQTFAWLNRCLEERVALTYEVRVLFEFADLRDDPRYAEVLRALNMTP